MLPFKLASASAFLLLLVCFCIEAADDVPKAAEDVPKAADDVPKAAEDVPKQFKCLDCTSTKDQNCINDVSKVPSVNCSSSCFTKVGPNAELIRGCGKDECLTNSKCITCAEDGCNNQLKIAQQLKCVQCDSRVQKDCIGVQKKDEAKSCTNQISLFETAACYEEVLNKSTVLRGCLYDRAADLVECKEPSCRTCSSGDGCNNNNIFMCIRCRSDLDPRCRKEAAKLTGGICRNQVNETTEQCYTGTWNDVAIRGCLVDADVRQKLVCEDKKDPQCQICNGQNCNVADAPGTASFKIASSLLVFTAMLLRCLF